MAQSIQLIQPPQVIRELLLDPVAGADDGFITDAIVRPNHTLEVGGIRNGKILRNDVAGAFGYGMGENPNGIADGARKPLIHHSLNTEVSWSTHRWGWRDEEATTRMPDFFRLGVDLNPTVQQRLDAQRWMHRENLALNGGRSYMQRQQEMNTVSKFCGTDHAGTDIAATKMVLSLMPGVPGSGGDIADENFPILKMIKALLRQMRDDTGANTFDVIIGQSVADALADNNTLDGTRIVGTPANGVVGIPTSNFDDDGVAMAIQQYITKVDRVLVGAARGNFAARGAAANIKNLWPSVISIIGSHNRPGLFMDGSNVRTEGTGIIKLNGTVGNTYAKLDEGENNIIWGGDRLSGLEIVDDKFVYTIFTDQ